MMLFIRWSTNSGCEVLIVYYFLLSCFCHCSLLYGKIIAWLLWPRKLSGKSEQFYLFVFCNPLTVVATSFSEAVLQKAGREQCLLECLLGRIDRKKTHFLLATPPFSMLHLKWLLLFLLKYFLRSNRHFPRIVTNCLCSGRETWTCHCGAEAFCRCTGKDIFSKVFLFMC